MSEILSVTGTVVGEVFNLDLAREELEHALRHEYERLTSATWTMNSSSRWFEKQLERSQSMIA